MLSDVLHQPTAVKYLRKVVEEKITSPLLLVGQEGVGRKFSVNAVVRELFCEEKRPSCDCTSCTQVLRGIHPDVMIVAGVDGKDIGIDAIRAVIEASNDYPSQAPVRVFLIDGADRLTVPAANALLKVLEEPPSTVRFFLLAETVKNVIPTIRSRCCVIAYQNLPEDFILAKLRDFETNPTKALTYARMAEGSVGKAIRYWGSGVLSHRDKVLSLFQVALEKDIARLFSVVDESSKDLPLFLTIAQQVIHDVLLSNAPERMIHQDSIQAITQMRGKASRETWVSFHDAVKRILNTSAPIQLPLHVKNAFLQSFMV